jgi:hypothetical protein
MDFIASVTQTQYKNDGLFERHILKYLPSAIKFHNLILTKAIELKVNSVALVRERTISTEPPPLVGEVVPTFCG